MSLSMLFVPLTARVMMKARPARAYWECLPIAVVGLGLLSLHMPIAFHPSRGWFLLTTLVQSIWFCYTSKSAREVPLIPLTTVQLGITGIVGLGSPPPSKAGISRLRCRPSAGFSPVSLSPPACASACK